MGRCYLQKSPSHFTRSLNSVTQRLSTQFTNLITLDLSKNQFSGHLSTNISNLKNHQLLNLLGDNELTGELPSQLGELTQLQTLQLGPNFFSGKIPFSIGKLTSLQYLDLSSNTLTGDRKADQSPVTWTRNLDSNLLNGSIPVKLWKSSSLMEFLAANNMLEGGLVEEIGSLLTLERFILSNNRLSGVIPKAIGMLSSLSVLNLNSNQFSGLILVEIGSLTFLTTLDLGGNRLNGLFPVEVTGLSELQCLVLSNNDLSGSVPYLESSSYFREVSIPDSSFIRHHGLYDLSNNWLTSEIPDELGDCLVVVDLLLNGNMLSGELPKSLKKLTNLTTLDLSGNLLSDGIPAEFGQSLKLQGLYLETNNLTGRIPVELGQLHSLVKLNLTGNRLSGSVPSTFGKLTGLTHLDLSRNLLDGELPSTLSSVVNLVGLFLQQNKLSGRLDDLFVGSMEWRIETINLSNNMFSEMLPRALGRLSYLITLDLHGNAFTGEIPWGIGNLMELEFLEFSNTKLEGPVPKTGICGNTPRITLSDNKALCGGVLGLQCPGTSFRRGSKFFSIWSLASIALGTLLITAFITIVAIKRVQRIKKRPDCEDPGVNNSSSADHNLYLLSSSRSKESLSINVAMFEQPLVKLTLSDIVEATNTFCKTKTVGDGGFGTVYKAQLPNGKIVAVKKLNQSKSQGQREFLAEMEILGKVRHRNLVIAVGSARDLAFLHHGFTPSPHIIHKDNKASNILLNEDFEPKVADFGLARIRVTFLSLIMSDRNFHNSYENQMQKISKLVSVTNFSEDCTARDIWKMCSDYGTVVDVFIPFKRSKSSKRFAFVRFIKVINLERLVSKLCTIWIGRYHLHTNYVRFERPQKPNSFIPRGPNHSTPKEMNMENSKKSFVSVLKRGSQSHVTTEITKPDLVLDETCIKEFDFGMSLMGRAKDVSAIPNIPYIISNKRFPKRQTFISWRDHERIVLISIEGLPIKAWTPNNFHKIASLWGEYVEWEEADLKSLSCKHLCLKTSMKVIINERQKVIIQGKVYWTRVKELDAWFPNFQEDDQYDLSSDGESQEGDVANKADNNESDVDRVS
nr:leucine-rich repeat receptor protein kinase EMS1 [Tanacetum cinerariifolium]